MNKCCTSFFVGNIITNTTLSTVGSGNSLVNDGSGPDLKIKSIVAGDGINIINTKETITINSTSEEVILESVGNGNSLVNDGSSPDLKIKSLIAGDGILIDTNNESIIISSTSLDITLESIGIGNSLVNDGIGPDLKIKSIVAGNGINITNNNETITLNSTSSEVTLESIGTGNSLVNDGIGPNLKVKSLISGSGIFIDSTDDENTISIDFSQVTLSGVGTDGESLVVNGIGPNLSVKNIYSDDSISVSSFNNNIELKNNTILSSNNVDINSNLVINGNPSNYIIKGLKAGNNIIITDDNNDLLISSNVSLFQAQYLYVDSLLGDDSTAEYNNPGKAFKTISQAVIASSQLNFMTLRPYNEDYVIYVRCGEYNVNSSLPFVPFASNTGTYNLYFDSGSVVKSNTVLFQNGGGGQKFNLNLNITGNGRFVGLSSLSRILNIDSTSGSNIYIECELMETLNNCCIRLDGQSQIQIKVKKYITRKGSLNLLRADNPYEDDDLLGDVDNTRITLTSDPLSDQSNATIVLRNSNNSDRHLIESNVIENTSGPCILMSRASGSDLWTIKAEKIISFSPIAIYAKDGSSFRKLVVQADTIISSTNNLISPPTVIYNSTILSTGPSVDIVCLSLINRTTLQQNSSCVYATGTSSIRVNCQRAEMITSNPSSFPRSIFYLDNSICNASITEINTFNLLYSNISNFSLTIDVINMNNSREALNLNYTVGSPSSSSITMSIERCRGNLFNLIQSSIHQSIINININSYIMDIASNNTIDQNNTIINLFINTLQRNNSGTSLMTLNNINNFNLSINNCILFNLLNNINVDFIINNSNLNCSFNILRILQTIQTQNYNFINNNGNLNINCDNIFILSNNFRFIRVSTNKENNIVCFLKFVSIENNTQSGSLLFIPYTVNIIHNVDFNINKLVQKGSSGSLLQINNPNLSFIKLCLDINSQNIPIDLNITNYNNQPLVIKNTTLVTSALNCITSNTVNTLLLIYGYLLSNKSTININTAVLPNSNQVIVITSNPSIV